MKVYNVTDERFTEYGQVLQGYDFKDLFDALSELEVPDEGIVYKPSVPSLENSAAKETCFFKRIWRHAYPDWICGRK